MRANYLFLGALNAALAIVLGAFGAHGLKTQLSAQMLSVFHTGVEYHGYHALGLILLGLFIRAHPTRGVLHASGVCMLIGIVLFSGSLYVLSLSGLRWLGMITPLGGTAFIIAWLLFAYAAVKQAKEDTGA